MKDDERLNIADLQDAYQALEIALEALRKAREGQGQENRDQFVFQVGFARGRLERVAGRIYAAGETRQ